ncbi:helix-turn-helix domain-containing protein [Pseudonocardia alni]|uniref:helix-turn-helix domain-containing protein n=1 Tax=Pseudonocardia alni TaxID=33907 RepID=UPI003330E181
MGVVVVSVGAQVLEVVDRAVGPRIEVYRWIITAPTAWAVHSHVDHEFLVVVSGGVRVRAGDLVRTAVPGSGVWIPAGVRHAVSAPAGTTFLVGYVDRDRRATVPVGLTGFPTPPLTTALAEHLLSPVLDAPVRARAEEVLCDQLVGGPTVLPDLPMPRSAPVRLVATTLLGTPQDRRTLEQWGFVVGVSARTLTRRFTEETGLGFESWRRRCRVLSALPMLTGARPVRAVAHRVGYRSEAAFVAAFRRETGTTPGRWSAPVARLDGTG